MGGAKIAIFQNFTRIVPCVHFLTHATTTKGTIRVKFLEIAIFAPPHFFQFFMFKIDFSQF